MKHSQDGFAMFLLLVLVAVPLIGVGIYVYTQKSTNTQPVILVPRTASSTEEVPEISTSSSLVSQIDLSKVEPGFVFHEKGQGISRELQTIQSEARNILIGTEPDIAPIAYDAWLQGVGQRYGLLRVFHGVDGWTVKGDFIIDFVDRTSARISSEGDRDLYTQDAVVYISPGRVTYYKIDSPSALVLPGSALPAGQTYDGGYIPRNSSLKAFNPRETHTNNTLTISVFDPYAFVELPDNPLYQKMNKWLRDITLTLPVGEVLVPNE